VSGAVLRDPPGSVEEALQREYRRPDVNRFAELRTWRGRASAIWIETRERRSGLGAPAVSAGASA
jgi:hypothetical protein